jgi:glutamate-1-semialdehyde 2,1-aminomutase
MNNIGGISLEAINNYKKNQSELFARNRPHTAASLTKQAQTFVGNVPLHWMSDWPSPFPMMVTKAKDATIKDSDGNKLDDFCLGDTGSMFGHSPKPIAKALKKQAKRGFTYMLPTQDALDVGKLLVDIFGPFRWQITTTASDANRFALRVARAVTGRNKILVFNGCYHGAVDDTFVKLKDGETVIKPGLVGQVTDLTQNSVVAEFNDARGLAELLVKEDIACVIMEPVMTNSAMVLPEPEFLSTVRELTRKYGTLLLIDETHTVSTGLGGYTKVHGLDPDIFVVGKPVAGGIAAAVWGLSASVADKLEEFNNSKPSGYSGMGTTLSANPIQFAALKACLTHVMTEDNYAQMEKLAARLETGLAKIIETRQLPWHVVRVGARVEFICIQNPLKNGTEAYAAHCPELESAIHIGLLNKGSLIAPFHNMMLVSPVTKKSQIDRLIENFSQVTKELTQDTDSDK